MKRIFKNVICFSLCGILGIGSLLGSHITARASADIIDQLVYYALTVAGYVKLDMNGGGGGHSFGKGFSPSDPAGSSGKNIYQSVYDAFQYAYENHHIQEDASGNVTFDQEVTQNFYNIFSVTGIGGYSAKFLSGNPDFTDYSDASFVDATYVSACQEMRGLYSKYLALSYNQDKCVGFAVYDLSNVAYVALRRVSDYSNPVSFYDSNGNLINVNYRYVTCNYKYTSSGWPKTYYENTSVVANSTLDTYKYIKSDSGSTANFYMSLTGTYNGRPGVSNNQQLQESIYNQMPTVDYLFTSTPSSGASSFCFFASSPVVFGLDSTNGYHGWLASDDAPEWVNVNDYNVLPSVTGDQITNNDFRQVYNNYVNNVNEVYNNSTDDFDMESFLQVLRDQNVVVTTAIQNGVVDIIGVIQTTGQKIDIVIGLLEEIKGILENGDSGGGSSGGGLTSEQITQLLADLRYVKTNMVTTSEFQSVMASVSSALTLMQSDISDSYDELVSVNNELVAIYNRLVSMGSGGGSSQDDNYYYGDNYYITTYNNDFPSIISFGEDGESDFDDNVIDVMKGVVPFVFIFAVGALFTELAVEPQVPQFQIPFKIQSLGYEQTIDVDFSNFTALHNVLDYGFCILFIIGLMWYYIRLMQLIITTFF